MGGGSKPCGRGCETLNNEAVATSSDETCEERSSLGTAAPRRAMGACMGENTTSASASKERRKPRAERCELRRGETIDPRRWARDRPSVQAGGRAVRPR